MSDPKKLYRRIADSIAAEIESGHYKPGDRLPTERDLAVQFGVSRPSLREAMIALEIMGLIEAKQGLGITVARKKHKLPPITDSEIGAFELIEARRLFEGEVAALAATLINDEQLAELEDLMASMNDADPARAEKADREFHMTIARTTGNGAMVTSVENLWDWRYHSPLARNILARAADLGMKDRINEHTDILNALKNRSSGAARQAMHDHMDRVIDHLLRATELVAVENARKASSERRQAMASRFKALTGDP
ncbi:FadR/GntR family transcriptional regulator [Asticcacaulis sp. EMRT-3]|uniref:FadR/GntR family transcriptional regulator n=1 Tax=Asticcacaulis sp. EMRT-3 TaxID=3040349 RepID=UPI0024AF85D0|nr:FadR/GntR family transcriptional regulator [Asticcacaulis sp. EMRT-3]MDI7776456.1 FadR/GntR family transcriptional regulator [Asticcacaulis sp. EMRT-3]